MKEKLKKNWKEILLVVLLIFSMNKCTQSCNRANKIEDLNKELVIADSTYNYDVDSLSEVIKSLNAEIVTLREVNGVLKDNNDNMQTQILKKDSINAVNRYKIIKVNK